MKSFLHNRLFLFLLALLTAATAAAEVPGLNRDGYASLLREHRGKVILVNFWASWCKPCRSELTGLARIQTEYGGQGAVVLGVSVDGDATRLQQFLDDVPLPYPVYRSDLELRREQGAFLIPLTLVYAPDGTQVERHVGYVPAQAVEDEIRRHLAPATPGALAQELALRDPSR